ncbi:MAG: Na+/H+ antiporter subunit E [Oceanospirillaceae bacterium]|nr:Na+/H+ antiporter subunit E [Oceanospirillaceae bacterium]|tara:strand:- start:1290 stop:1778 length:489 start_codon:yes stop_codon:yes gene_type:complete
MIKCLFPMPFHTVILTLVWLFLNDFSVGHLVLGLILSIGICWLVAPMSDDHPKVRKPLRAIRYLLVVLWDILLSNFEVAIRVLSPNSSLRPGIVALPLDLEGEFPLAVLASTISLTPGTVSVDFSEDMKWLYIHVLHMKTEEDVIESIKQRYEVELKEIFAC